MKRRRPRRLKWILLWLCQIAVLITVIYLLENSLKSAPEETKIPVEFVSHIDGDTTWFLVNGVKTKVRYLAIDTEETVHPTKAATEAGKKASQYVEGKLSQADTIEQEYDAASDREDKYGRTLAWVWVNGKLLQEDLIEKGLARVAYVYGNYQYLQELETVQKEAQEAQTGIWAAK